MKRDLLGLENFEDTRLVWGILNILQPSVFAKSDFIALILDTSLILWRPKIARPLHSLFCGDFSATYKNPNRHLSRRLSQACHKTTKNCPGSSGRAYASRSRDHGFESHSFAWLLSYISNFFHHWSIFNQVSQGGVPLHVIWKQWKCKRNCDPLGKTC